MSAVTVDVLSGVATDAGLEGDTLRALVNGVRLFLILASAFRVHTVHHSQVTQRFSDVSTPDTCICFNAQATAHAHKRIHS